jgi:hypothetical protein
MRYFTTMVYGLALLGVGLAASGRALAEAPFDAPTATCHPAD